MSNPSTYVQRLLLGTELAKLRERTSLSQSDVQRELDFEASWLSRVERGERGMKPKDVRSLLDLYGRHVTIDTDQREELLQLSRNSFSGKPDWWRRRTHGLKPRFDVLLAAESGARIISVFQNQVMPGILQTPGYARAVIEATDLEGVVDVDERIAIRTTRQEILTRDEAPPRLEVILDEAVLHREVGGPQVMREQLRHLIEMSRLPNVKIQVLPYQAGAHAAMDGEFTLLVFRVSDDLGMVYLETGTSGLVLQSGRETRSYNWIFGTLGAKALSAEDSIAMITSLSQKETR